MIIDGRKIAEEILLDVKREVEALKKGGTTPTLMIIVSSDDVSTNSYIKQKRLKADETGIRVLIKNITQDINVAEVVQLVEVGNSDPKITGIIIQRPISEHIKSADILYSVNQTKDVDGFNPKSPFSVPVARAVWEILRVGFKTTDSDLVNLLKTKNVGVVGKGETAGKPIITFLQNKGLGISIADSKTDLESFLKDKDLIISCVGKENLIKPDYLKENAALVGVGMHRGEDGKLKGDYDVEKIKGKVSFYTPTPGGVGPVNVAYLMHNVITAAAKQKTNN